MNEKHQLRVALHEPAASTDDPAAKSIIENLLDAPRDYRGDATAAASAATTTLLGECIDDRHPALQGRVLVRLAEFGAPEREVWVPTLQGLPVRVADRVLLVRPANGEEWIVTGVVDGFARRPEVAKRNVAQLALRPDEAIQVVSSEGHALVEISRGQSGSVVRVLEPDVVVEFAGKLAVKAAAIEFVATRGPVTVTASDDVVLKGEAVRLN